MTCLCLSSTAHNFYCTCFVSLACLPAREADAEAIVQLQSTAFYESWGNNWVDKAFSSLFEVCQQLMSAKKQHFGGRWRVPT